jgi:hypothetical protein
MSAPDFRSLMVESERYGTRHRMFCGLAAGPFWLSVQGSTSHYSSPREVLPVEEYLSMEVAILRNGKMVHPSEVLKDCPPELVENWEVGGNPVGGYIPIARIQRLYELLCEVVS